MGKKNRKRNKSNTPREPAASACRDCGLAARVPRFEFFKASKPRCVACGGLLEYGGSWHRTRS
jgi:uncharacterized paraquat-inducible protein A